MNLRDFSTKALVDELKHRSGVTKIETGHYKPFELRQKYGGCPAQIASNCVLIVSEDELGKNNTNPLPQETFSLCKDEGLNAAIVYNTPSEVVSSHEGCSNGIMVDLHLRADKQSTERLKRLVEAKRLTVSFYA